MPAIPVHHTDTVDSPWDGGAQEKSLDKTQPVGVWKWMYAWQDKGAVDGDADGTDKEDFVMPHHMVDGGKPAAANVKACTSAIGILNGGMGGSRVPDSDRQAVYDHLAAHLKDGKVDVPDLKSRNGGGLEQRREMRSQLHNVRETRVCPADFEFRELPDGSGGTSVVFTGYASVTCASHDDTSAAYEMEDWLGPWTESVVRGAFAATLRNKADVAFLVNHEGITLARTKPGTLLLAEDATGLHVEARLDPANPLVAQVRSGVERGDLDEMSFAFRVTRQDWNEDYTQRWITEVNMAQGDVSVVNFGANPHTGGLVAVRSVDQHHAERLAATFAALYERREGKTLSGDTMSCLSQVLSLSSQADDAVDQVQILLSDLMGVPNPDNDDQWDGLAGGGDDGSQQNSAAAHAVTRSSDVALVVRRNREREAKLRRRAA